jgi:predicted  nucleic acid-binding Zn-ribbon protein
MPARTNGTTTTTSAHTMYTEVAVLKTQMEHIEDKVAEVKDEVKNLDNKIETNHKAMLDLFKELQDDNKSSHEKLTDKINAIEKWKWMVMGGCIILGAFGNQLLSIIL